MPQTWPASLPQAFQAGSYSESEPDALLETPEVAVPKSRPLWTAAGRNLAGPMDMDLTQIAALRVFGRTTLILWSQPFWFPVQSGDEDPAMPGYWLVKFQKSGVPKYSAIESMGGALFSVSLQLFILPP